MAQAPLESSMSDHAESSTAAMFSRNDDAMTVALRSERELDLDDIVHLNRTAPPSRDVHSSVGTLTTTVFSSREESQGTKPTSAGTSYPIEGRNGKGKGIATYASSLSATQGSASEAEAEQDKVLLGVGGIFDDDPINALNAPPLKGAARACKRPRTTKRLKKPPVIIHHDVTGASSEDDESPTAEHVLRRNSKETKYLRRRTVKSERDASAPAEALLEDGYAPHVVEAPESAHAPLSRARLYVLIALVLVIGLTFILSVFAAHYTGKSRMACTKGIIFSATVLMSSLTVLAMAVARRALQEALLAGLLELFVGFALVFQIHDFMWHVQV